MFKRPCIAQVFEANSLIHDQETILYYIFVEPATKATLGTMNIFDGWDAAGVPKFRIVTGEGRLFPFYPPFICNDALYIAIDQAIASYSLGWLPAKVVFPELYKVELPK